MSNAQTYSQIIAEEIEETESLTKLSKWLCEALEIKEEKSFRITITIGGPNTYLFVNENKAEIVTYWGVDKSTKEISENKAKELYEILNNVWFLDEFNGE